MIRRLVLPIAVVVGLVVLAVGISTVPAQPPGGMPMMPGMPGQVGRFVVAHASDKQIVILDTTTGKLYRATESDFKKASELPKAERPRGPGGFAPGGGFRVPPDKAKEFEKYRKEFEKTGKVPKDVKPPRDRKPKEDE